MRMDGGHRAVDAASVTSGEQKLAQSGFGRRKKTWPDGRTYWVSTTKMPLRSDDGKIVGTFGISRDITEQKERQLQMEAEPELAREVQHSFLEAPEMSFPKSGTASGGIDSL
jgi:hypothetical protein